MQNPNSIGDQIRRCSRFVEQRGGLVSGNAIFSDSGISGASLDRPGFNSLMTQVRQGLLDVMVCEDLSRISRDVADAATLVRELIHRKVRLLGASDGTDSQDKNGRLNLIFNAFRAEMYLVDLGDKTLRGLEGRALDGLSTGGLPFGYISRPKLNATGRHVGSEIVIDQHAAALVVRIFEMYKDGMSPPAIAGQLNLELVPTPRTGANRRAGWTASTISFMLRNAAYVGLWSFKKKCWTKEPGTNHRHYAARDDSEVMHFKRPELRIIDDALWQDVRARCLAIKEKYGGTRSRASVAFSRKTTYPLSGLLECGACGAPMVITTGSSASYYVCGDHKKRRNCSNSSSIREDVIRRQIITEVRRHFLNFESYNYLRKRIAVALGNQGRSTRTELEYQSGELERAEVGIQRLVETLATGFDSPAVRQGLREREKTRDTLKASIAVLKCSESEPAILPTIEDVRNYVTQLDDILVRDAVSAREALRRLFGGPLKLHPQDEGQYIVEGTLFPLVALAQKLAKPRESGASWYNSSCAGRI